MPPRPPGGGRRTFEEKVAEDYAYMRRRMGVLAQRSVARQELLGAEGSSGQGMQCNLLEGRQGMPVHRLAPASASSSASCAP